MRFVALSLSICMIAMVAQAEPKKLEQIAFETLEKVMSEQIQIEGHKYYLKGEFPTKIKSTLVPALVGVGKVFGQDDEATGFTTGSVLNVLGDIYLHHPELQAQPTLAKIPMVFELAIPTFARYENQGSYNFYPARTIEGGIVVRRPIDMTLFPLWHGFTNIPNDSDSSSVILMSQAIYRKIKGLPSEMPIKALEQMSSYRDIKRNPMYYNRMERRKKTGAFMTWLFDEHDPQMPRFFFARSKEGPRIPFNKNDVDCVVNANILKLLALLDTEISGKSETCEMLNSMIEKDESGTCGVYYPNTYNLAFSLTTAKSFGNQCISETNEKLMINRILEQQNPDGSWENIGNIWKDQTLSTAFALNSILTAGSNDYDIRPTVYRGIRYLLLNAKKSKSYEWHEDNFFTATAIARSLIMWRSKAYTHAIIASVLLKASKLFPEITDKEIINDRL